jgi:predicted DCC family thiol-disulfide oxidoreductase YuxK
MATIQGRLADGRWVRGVEVFRQLYGAVGFTRAVRFSRLRPIAWVLDRSYALFAKHRLRLTRRCVAGSCTLPNELGRVN